LLEHLNGVPPQKLSSEFLDLSRRVAREYYHLSFGERKSASDNLRELDRLSAELAEEAERTTRAASR
jgi:hypothetical protein